VLGWGFPLAYIDNPLVHTVRIPSEKYAHWIRENDDGPAFNVVRRKDEIRMEVSEFAKNSSQKANGAAKIAAP